MLTYQLFLDAGLTNPVTGPVLFQAALNGQDVDQIFFFGSSEPDRLAQSVSNPGVDQLTLAPVVATTLGNSVLPTDFVLALTAEDLADTQPGAPINLGLSLPSQTPVPVHVRFLVNRFTEVFRSTEIQLQTNLIRESAL